MKQYARVLRAAIGICLTIPLDPVGIFGYWSVVIAAVATYLAFTAFTGECAIRHYFLHRMNSIANK